MESSRSPIRPKHVEIAFWEYKSDRYELGEESSEEIIEI
jgi:hypothetical protein